MDFDQQFYTDFLERLLNIPSPSGATDEAVDFVGNAFKEAGLSIKKTNKRALIATLPGKSKKGIVFSGHVDTLGLMVKEIRDDGTVGISLLGGYAPVTIEGNYVTIKTSQGKEYRGTVLFSNESIHTYKNVATAERKVEDMYVRIDEEVNNKDDVEKLGIAVGDFISLDPNTEILKNGFIKSRHLDDKSGICAMLGIAKYFTDHNITPEYTLHFYVSNYEEIGHGSSAAIPDGTEEFISVDMAAMGESQSSREDAVTICAKDSSGPYDLKMKEDMVRICKEKEIDFEIDIYKYYGSDASAMQRAGYDIRAIVIGPGVDASHAYERTHWKGIRETMKLGIEYVLSK